MAVQRKRRRSVLPPCSAARQAPRKRPVDWEGQEQAVVIRWLLGEKMRGTPVGQLYDVTYHVPNGGARYAKTASDLKKQGAKAGVSDLVVMEARGGYFGLYLEFKATPPKHATLQESQRDWLALAEARGYCAVLARGLEEAKAVLAWYADQAQTEIETWVDVDRVECPVGTEWRREEQGDECSTSDDAEE